MSTTLSHLDHRTHHSFFHSSKAANAHEKESASLREYWERGYIALRGLFAKEEIQEWSKEADRLLQLDLIHPDNIRSPFWQNSGDKPERINPVIDISPVFEKLVRDPRIISVVESIFGDKAYLFKDKLIFKAPGTTGYTMHQDQAYWQLCPADDILSVSIQIDGASAEKGCIELFPAKHHEMLTPVGVRRNFEPDEVAQIDPATGEKMETQPGDILIFHSLAPHQSGPNTASFSRRSIYLTYSSASHGDLYLSQLENYIAYATVGVQSYYR